MSLIRTLDLRDRRLTEPEVSELLPRAQADGRAAELQVKPLLDRIATEGLKAVIDITRQFDDLDPVPIRVTEQEIESAVAGLNKEIRGALDTAIERVTKFSTATMPKSMQVDFEQDSMVTLRFEPVESVGCYVPGGKAIYPSSAIMNVVPARVAGVKSISIASPGRKEYGGRPHPIVLATAGLLEVRNVFVLGGVSAIGAFAYGLEDLGLRPVRMITGPGNIFVAAAKKLVRGKVAIDAEAGATEIMVLADSSANPNLIAADLISQAEHDELAAAILVTDSDTLIKAVSEELDRIVDSEKNAERIRAALSGNQSALVLVDSIAAGIEIAHHYATEHLEILTENPSEVAKAITNAGAVFLGEYSPVSLGDYLAGSNHVLPTAGSAKFDAGLSVYSFLRPQQLISYTEAGLAGLSEKLASLAEFEGLPAHGNAVKRRFSGK